MRTILLVAALTLLLVIPAAGQRVDPRTDAFTDRLTFEVFGGYLPGSTDEMWLDVDWWFGTGSRHLVETSYGAAPAVGAGARYQLNPLVRLTGSFVFTRRDDRAVRLNSGSMVRFQNDGNDYYRWDTRDGSTSLFRVGLEVAPYHSDAVSVWVGGGPGMARSVASASESVPAGFTETWIVPTAFVTGRVEVPLLDGLGLALAADHHWTWWDDDDLAAGVEQFFDPEGEGTVDAESRGLVARMWLLRLGLTYSLN